MKNSQKKKLAGQSSEREDAYQTEVEGATKGENTVLYAVIALVAIALCVVMISAVVLVLRGGSSSDSSSNESGGTVTSTADTSANTTAVQYVTSVGFTLPLSINESMT